MKNRIIYTLLFAFAGFVGLNAQVACNTGITIELDENGTASVPVSTLLAGDIDFLLSSSDLAYIVFPNQTAAITSEDDVVEFTCANLGASIFLVEQTENGNFLSNCWGEILVTNPSGSCENNVYCDTEDECSKAVSYHTIVPSFPVTVAATTFALCDNSTVCTGEYRIAKGDLEDAETLMYTSDLTITEDDIYGFSVVLSYTHEGTTVYDDGKAYFWDPSACTVITAYDVPMELDENGMKTIIASDFLALDNTCDDLLIAKTFFGGIEPGIFETSLDLDCDDVGFSTIYVKDPNTGFTSSSTLFLSDPQNACDNTLEPGQKLVSIGNSNAFFSTAVYLNGSILLDQHPSGGWIVEESDLQSGTNTLNFDSGDFNLSGLSTLDLVRAVRLIIYNDYDYPMQPIVFDMDNSGYLGLQDLIISRELILGILEDVDIPNYLFKPIDEDFTDFDPFNFDYDFTKYDFEMDDFETSNFAFVAYKMGDFSGANGLKDDEDDSQNRALNALDVTKMEVTAGEDFSFVLSYGNGVDIKGLLTAVVSDGIEFTNLSAGTAGSEIQYNIIDETEIRISYLPTSTNDLVDKVSFFVQGTASKSGKLVDLLGLKAGFPQEIVDANDQVIELNEIVEEGLVGIEDELLNSEISIYPNPAFDVINIDMMEDVEKDIEITNALGINIYKRIIAPQQNSISIQDLNDGLYFITIKTVKGYKTLSFVKE